MDRRTGRESVTDWSLASETIMGRCQWKTLQELGSDHRPILIEVSSEREKVQRKKVLTWAWKKAKWEIFTEVMEEKTREAQGETVKQKVEWLTQSMLEAANEAIPKKKVSRYNRPFWDEELQALTQRRDVLRKDIRNHLEEWKEANKEIKDQVTEKRRKFWRSYVETMDESADSKKAW